MSDYNAGWKGGSMAGRKKGQYMRGWDDRQKQINNMFGSPPSRTCFPSAALVRTPKGWQEIAKLIVGDEVLGFNEATKTASVRRISRRFDHASTTLWEIQTSTTDQPILTTEGHLFLTDDGWKKTSDIGPDDALITVDDTFKPSFSKVLAVRKTSRKEPVCNLYTTIDHTYIVAGCVVHNFSHFRWLRTWLHRLLVDPDMRLAPSGSRAIAH